MNIITQERRGMHVKFRLSTQREVSPLRPWLRIFRVRLRLVLGMFGIRASAVFHRIHD